MLLLRVFPMIALGLLVATAGCGGNGGQPRQMSLPKLGTVYISNAANNTVFRTLIYITYDLDVCVPPAHQGDCYVAPTCPNRTHVSAGAITLTGKTSVTIMPAPEDNAYPPQFLANALADEGETIQVEAAGADVPAHAGTVTMPDTLMVTIPSGIDRSRDFPLQWVPGTSTVNASLVVFSPSDPTPSESIGCSFRDSDGAGTIPGSLLQQLPDLSVGSSTILSLTRSSSSSTTAGAWPVSFTGGSSVQQTVEMR